MDKISLVLRVRLLLIFIVAVQISTILYFTLPHFNTHVVVVVVVLLYIGMFFSLSTRLFHSPFSLFLFLLLCSVFQIHNSILIDYYHL